jgi:hypothetical protein
VVGIFATLFCFFRLNFSHSKPTFLVLDFFPPWGNFRFSRNLRIQWLTHRDYSSTANWRINVSRFISRYICNVWRYIKIYLFMYLFIHSFIPQYSAVVNNVYRWGVVLYIYSTYRLIPHSINQY